MNGEGTEARGGGGVSQQGQLIGEWWGGGGLGSHPLNSDLGPVPGPVQA